MEWLEQRSPAPPRPSATVMLLRDAPGLGGLEVFLLQRHDNSDVLGGAFVFPGGKVDQEDADAAGALDVSPDALQAALGEPELAAEDAAALHVAAIREVFEETGLLLADVEAAGARESWATLRTGLQFGEMVGMARWRLLASALAPWSRWVTPLVGGVVRKRFDTRFFVAAVPTGQAPTHDTHEATASLWLAPRTALQRYWDGDMALAPPQIMTLAHLARQADVASAFAAARGRRPPLIEPKPVPLETGRALCYPGDPAHPVTERAMPGPTRLFWRNDRFEPEGGLAELLGD